MLECEIPATGYAATPWPTLMTQMGPFVASANAASAPFRILFAASAALRDHKAVRTLQGDRKTVELTREADCENADVAYLHSAMPS